MSERYQSKSEASEEKEIPEKAPSLETRAAKEEREREFFIYQKTAKEIEVITKGRPLGELTIDELRRVKRKYQELKQALGLEGESSVSPERAREIMGENFYGSKEIKNVFGFEIGEAEIPPVPYSPETLERARELGEMLILRVGQDGEGNPMTMERINQIMEFRMDKDKEGELLYDTDWYKNEDFYKKDSLKTEWRLVGGSFVPDLTSKKDEEGRYTKDSRSENYARQTMLLREYLKVVDALTETEEKECSDEALRKLSEKIGVDWESGEIIDADKYDANWEEVAREFSKLTINVNHRRIPAEIIYDWILKFKKEKDRGVLENNFDWSNALSSTGHLVAVGSVGSDGAGVDGSNPGVRGGPLGVVSLR